MPNVRSSRFKNRVVGEQFGTQRTLSVKANVAYVDGDALAENFWSSHHLKSSITRAESGLDRYSNP